MPWRWLLSWGRRLLPFPVRRERLELMIINSSDKSLSCRDIVSFTGHRYGREAAVCGSRHGYARQVYTSSVLPITLWHTADSHNYLGTDLILMDKIHETLVQNGLPTRVEAGKRMFSDGEGLGGD